MIGHEDDAYDDILFGHSSEDAEWAQYGQADDKVCKRCGKDSLHWGNVKEVWRLHDKNNVIHHCNKLMFKKFTKD